MCDVGTGVDGDEGIPSDPMHDRGNGGEKEEEGIEAGFRDKAALAEAHPSDRSSHGGGDDRDGVIANSSSISHFGARGRRG